ncbi:MAG: TetR/AcrR family transcriptional regulator [Ruminococcaceae bacterium]|nr:TetR/AcrR family transcriptional regulator [Oscillospiraceae bacterium]
MKNGNVIREALLENTIRLIGDCGFEKATTKGIVSLGIDDPNIRLNEVYIYRIFGSKELLYSEAFSVLDKELFAFVRNSAANFFDDPCPFVERIRNLFNKLWRFLLGNECRCRCYVRFYYSAYFHEQTLRKHRELLDSQESVFSPIFKDEADVITIIHTTFMTLMDFAIRVYNGDIEDNEDNAYHIFNLLYYSLSSYFDPIVLEGRRKSER